MRIAIFDLKKEFTGRGINRRADGISGRWLTVNLDIELAANIYVSNEMETCIIVRIATYVRTEAEPIPSSAAFRFDSKLDYIVPSSVTIDIAVPPCGIISGFIT